MTTENVTTQNVTTQNVTTENLSAANITTGNTTTENVQTMYVANMVGGNNGLPNTNPSTPGLDSDGSGFNGYVPILPPGGDYSLPSGGDYSLPSGGDTPLLPPGDSNVNIDTGGGDVNIGTDGGGDAIHLNPDEWQFRDPNIDPNENDGPRIPFDPYSLIPLAVLAAGTLPAMFAQWDNEKGWKESLESAEATADALEEALGEADKDAEILRTAAQAVGPNRKADGSYDTDFTGLFLNMNPTDQGDFLLQALGDPKMRGILYSDIMAYGPTNGLGERATSSGNLAWNELLRYWGDYTEETWPGSGDWRHVDDPLDAGRVDALITYLRETYQRKVEDRLERMKDADFDSALDDALGASGKNGLIGRLSGSFLRYLNADQWTGGGSTGAGAGQDGITHTDLANFNNLPAQLQQAAMNGTMKGVSGIRVYMDGVAVGHLVAPTVSQDIARDMA